MGFFGDRRRRREDEEKGIVFEFYEDTHDERGDYVGPSYGKREESGSKSSVFRDVKNSQNAGQSNRMSSHDTPFNLPNQSQQITPRNYQNVVVYCPSTPEDVQTLIDFLKRREPAIVNLDGLDKLRSQRILDFVSGAIYALNGNVHRVAGNIFLLSPEGVEITVPYEN